MVMLMYRATDDAESSCTVWSDVTNAVKACHSVVPALRQHQTRSMDPSCLLCWCLRQWTCSVERELL